MRIRISIAFLDDSDNLTGEQLERILEIDDDCGILLVEVSNENINYSNHSRKVKRLSSSH